MLCGLRAATSLSSPHCFSALSPATYRAQLKLLLPISPIALLQLTGASVAVLVHSFTAYGMQFPLSIYKLTHSYLFTAVAFLQGPCLCYCHSCMGIPSPCVLCRILVVFVVSYCLSQVDSQPGPFCGLWDCRSLCNLFSILFKFRCCSLHGDVYLY